MQGIIHFLERLAEVTNNSEIGIVAIAILAVTHFSLVKDYTKEFEL